VEKPRQIKDNKSKMRTQYFAGLFQLACCHCKIGRRRVSWALSCGDQKFGLRSKFLLIWQLVLRWHFVFCLPAVVYIFFPLCLSFIRLWKKVKEDSNICTNVRMCTNKKDDKLYLPKTSHLEREKRYIYTGKINTKLEVQIICEL